MQGSLCHAHQTIQDPFKTVDLVPMEPWQGILRWKCPVPGCDTVQWQGSAPASQEVRNLRHSCHKLFDRLWKPGEHQRFVTRREAYKWMQEVMALPTEMCHIGYFGQGQCELLLKALTQPFRVLKPGDGEVLRGELVKLPPPKVQ